MPGIEFRPGTPVYRQIADWIAGQIESGAIKEGERLPTERKLCEELSVSRDTVKRAYEALEGPGFIRTVQGSGSYACRPDLSGERKKVEKMLREAIYELNGSGLTWHEIENLFLERIWSRLPEREKVRVAWVDCSKEILKACASELALSCNAKVIPVLLDDVREDAGILINGGYDMAVTTINHVDDVKRLVKKKNGGKLPFEVEMVVMSPSRMSISQVARIGREQRAVLVYEEQWYLYSMKRYLKELGLKGRGEYVPIDGALSYLEDAGEDAVVILPQDMEFMEGLPGKLRQYCEEHKMGCFQFCQVIDEGSLMHLKKKIQEFWVRK
ncbi:GntR family transcriptional regulator [uncultured Clostridium sp.]|uniref:GntR family transcriptional regulator n=1 Tax=uncultured Clostridium sp. TaxID=59620 RepID=UPI0025FED26D|nr:GntR family transcriptional regulator [uncultured Clostridium sp.]